MTTLKHRIAVNRFFWDKQDRELIGDISELGIEGLSKTIIIENTKTGRECEFAYARTDRNTDGEPVAWHYVPRTVGSQVSRVIIVND